MFLKTKKNILFVRDYLLKVINNGPLVFQNFQGGGGVGGWGYRSGTLVFNGLIKTPELHQTMSWYLENTRRIELVFLHVHFEHLITHFDLINLFIHLFSADLSRIESLDIKKNEKKMYLKSWIPVFKFN